MSPLVISFGASIAVAGYVYYSYHRDYMARVNAGQPPAQDESKDKAIASFVGTFALVYLIFYVAGSKSEHAEVMNEIEIGEPDF
jgi:hypothetical protein